MTGTEAAAGITEHLCACFLQTFFTSNVPTSEDARGNTSIQAPTVTQSSCGCGRSRPATDRVHLLTQSPFYQATHGPLPTAFPGQLLPGLDLAEVILCLKGRESRRTGGWST